MSATTKTLDYFAWVEKFRPIEDPKNPGALRQFQYYGDDIAILEAADPACIWTELDVDGETIIGSGIHHVNRLHYYITAVPVPAGEVWDIFDEVPA